METQGKTLPWSFEQDFETESGLKAGVLEDQVCGALGSVCCCCAFLAR